MLRRRRVPLSFFVVLVLVLTTSGHPANAEPAGRLEEVSSKSFDQTVQQLNWAFGGYGLTIVAALDYQQILKKLKVESRRSVIFEVLRRPWAKTILEHDPGAGLEIPLRVYVYERADGRTVVSYYQPSAIFGAYGSEGLKQFARELDEKLRAIVWSATR